MDIILSHYSQFHAINPVFKSILIFNSHLRLSLKRSLIFMFQTEHFKYMSSHACYMPFILLLTFLAKVKLAPVLN
jgi:hypothetical protein